MTSFSKMEAIFHEKQEGSLCAQHCLNALLQGEYFTAVDLATLARKLDEEEQVRMAEGGITSPEYLKFLEQPSGNMDDSGFFSVQVISSALSVWGLDLEPYYSEPGISVENLDHILGKALICNYREHWFTVRKLGHQWFNLNSLLTGPELISNTYLSMFLAQLQQEGYSIFIVIGNLPECEADQVLQIVRATQAERPKLLSELKKRENKASTSKASESTSSSSSSSTAASSSSSQRVKMEDLQKALQASQQYLDPEEQSEEEQLQEAIRLSMQGLEETESPQNTKKLDIEEVRRKRQEYFSRQQEEQKKQSEEEIRDDISDKLQADDEELSLSSQDSQTERTCQEVNDSMEGKAVSDMTEDEMLQAALELSMKAEG